MSDLATVGQVCAVVVATMGALKTWAVLAAKKRAADDDLEEAKTPAKIKALETTIDDAIREYETDRARASNQRREMLRRIVEQERQTNEWRKLAQERAVELAKMTDALAQLRKDSDDCNERGEATQRDVDRHEARIGSAEATIGRIQNTLSGDRWRAHRPPDGSGGE